MNAIFGIIITLSTFMLIFSSPEAVLSTMLEGGQSALDLTLKMVVIYAVWSGVFKIMERSGLSNIIEKLLRPINRFLFGKIDDVSNDFISLNLSANLLGMSGATTTMGIKSIQELEKHPNTDYAITMFFVINATSIQQAIMASGLSKSSIASECGHVCSIYAQSDTELAIVFIDKDYGMQNRDATDTNFYVSDEPVLIK